MPLGDVPYAASEDLLDAGEIEAVVRAAASVGFRRIRFTGGEPTLRRDLVEIVERCSRVDGIRDIAMTTNGILLPPLAEPLRDAGLNRVNIHVDKHDSSGDRRSGCCGLLAHQTQLRRDARTER